MASSRNKSILGVISILSLISASYLLFKLSFKIGASSFYLNLAATTISSFNISILFGWFAFGIFGGILVGVIATAVVLWFGLRTALLKDYIFILPFFITTVIGYICSRIRERIDQTYYLKSEKLDEELNLFAHSIEEKKNYIKSLEEKLSGYSVLKEVAESFSMVVSMDDINRLIIYHTLMILKKEARILLFLVDNERQELMLSVSKDMQGPSKVRTKKGDIFDRWVLKHRKPLFIEDITRDFRFSAESTEEARLHFRSLISSPLVSEDRVIGILRMDSLKEHIYTHDDLWLLDIISDLGAVAIENAMLYSRTQALAIRDGLTELFLRRYFMERFREEVRRAARKKENLSLLMLDIDHFKNYNDKFGHVAGDLVLKHLVRKIKSLTKENDILARYGGEEIVVLLLGTDINDAVTAAETIRKHIEEEPLILRREKARVTISIGISSYPQDALAEEELIKIADMRLYKAKSEGRNRTCAA